MVRESLKSPEAFPGRLPFPEKPPAIAPRSLTGYTSHHEQPHAVPYETAEQGLYGVWPYGNKLGGIEVARSQRFAYSPSKVMIGHGIHTAVEQSINLYEDSRLAILLDNVGPYAIKFVRSRWAASYLKPARLKISQTPALTWGTATYVTPLAFPLSSALYGRIGLVSDFDPSGWRVFDATDPAARMAYVNWVRAQPAFSDLVLTVHSTHANHLLRNKFRHDFRIDCVLFHPDQEAEIHTDLGQHVWMAVTDWNPDRSIDSTMSTRFGRARFTVLIDEEFELEDNGLPIQRAARQIERITERILNHHCLEVGQARMDPNLPATVVNFYKNNGYLHVYIKP